VQSPCNGDEDDNDDDSDNVSETTLSFTAVTNTASASSVGMTATADIQKSTAGTATTTTTTPDYRTGSTPSNPTSTVSDSIIGVHFHDIIRRHSKDIFGAILKVQCVNVR